MGQTLVNPLAQLTDVLIIGQLQSQSHCSAPSGQLHLQEHGIPSPIGTGTSPDPEPVGGGGPDPEPVGSTGPDPEPLPVGSTGPDPEPVGSTGPTVGITATVHLAILPLPFLTARVKE